MRILEVLLAPIIGGAERLVGGLTAEFRAQGHHVDVVTLDAASSPEMESLAERIVEGSLISPPPTPVGRRSPLPRQLQRVTWLRGVMAAGHYDIVHAHTLLPSIYARLAISTMRKPPPVVITLHSASTTDDYRHRRVRLLERALIKRTAAVVSVSDGAAAEYLSLFPEAANRVSIIPNGVDVPAFEARVPPEGPLRHVAVSRIARQKDIVTLLNGFDQFAECATPGTGLMIVGPFVDSAYEAEVRVTHRAMSSRDQVTFAGPMSDVWPVLRRADAFVHAARAENHPIAVIEAAATGLPIVASDLPQIRSILGDDACYFHAGDASGLGHALTRLADDYPRFLARSEALAERVRSDYALRTTAGRYLSIFSDALINRPRLRPGV